MPRVSKQQMALNHERVLKEASRLVRERGADGVSVTDVMGAAGLTAGGFYKHFSSKDDLLARAGAAAFDERLAALARITEAADPTAARERFVSDYLSTRHRDQPGRGCAAVALAADAGRRDADDPVHRGYVEGMRAMADALRALRAPTDNDADTLADLATLVGAVVIARATAGDEMSDDVLAAARDRLLGR